MVWKALMNPCPIIFSRTWRHSASPQFAFLPNTNFNPKPSVLFQFSMNSVNFSSSLNTVNFHDSPMGD